MNPVILFRSSLAEEGEHIVAQKYFTMYGSRAALPENSLVIPRYSALPYYEELEKDVEWKRSKLINSLEQHRFVADIRNWYPTLQEFTPKTWMSLQEWRARSEDKTSKYGWFLKGSVNSRKQLWSTHAYAATEEDVPAVWGRLQDDTFISEQDVVIRKYVPLRKLGEQINSMPVTNEWRCFFYRNNLLAEGFYWSNFEDLNPYPDLMNLPTAAHILLEKVAARISKYCNFYVVDIAETATGKWIVIELNDASMSGPSCCDLDTLYNQLRNSL